MSEEPRLIGYLTEIVSYSVHYNGKHIGTFNTIEEAQEAFLQAVGDDSKREPEVPRLATIIPCPECGAPARLIMGPFSTIRIANTLLATYSCTECSHFWIQREATERMTDHIEQSICRWKTCYTVIFNGKEMGTFPTLNEAQSFYETLTKESGKCEQV